MKIAVIGLGYVGMPLAVEFSKKYPVVGFDINEARVKELQGGSDRTREIDSSSLKEVLSLSDTNHAIGLKLSHRHPDQPDGQTKRIVPRNTKS